MKKLIVLLACVILGLASCSSTKNTNSYYDANYGDFTQLKLDNGIPLVMKNTGRGQIAVVCMVIEGGTPLLTVEKSGLEDVTLDLMYHGSRNYPYEKLQQLEYETSFSVSTASSKDYSTVKFKCIDRDLNTALDVLADGFLEPLMQKDDFDQIMNLNQMQVQRQLSDPSGTLGLELQKAVYASHEYAPSSSVNEASLNSITLEDVLKHYDSLKDAARIKFVAVGNFSDGKDSVLFEKLNGHFGKLPRTQFKKPVISKIKLNKKTVYAANSQAEKIGYVAGYFDAPDRYDGDYVPFAIALMYLDNTLFNLVREQNGACYSVGTGVLGGKDMLGALSVYKSTKNRELKQLLFKAIDEFPSEKEVAEKLENYKSKYITELFSSSQDTAGVANNIVVSLEYADEPYRYLSRPGEILKVNPAQVMSAYRKYIAPKKISWVVVSGEEELKEFDF